MNRPARPGNVYAFSSVRALLRGARGLLGTASTSPAPSSGATHSRLSRAIVLGR
jgi:hypothetical protein